METKQSTPTLYNLHNHPTLGGFLQNHRFSFVFKIRQCLLLATSAVRLSRQVKEDIISSTTVVTERPVPADFLTLWDSEVLLGGEPMDGLCPPLPRCSLPTSCQVPEILPSPFLLCLTVPGMLPEALITLPAYRTWQVLCSLGGPPAETQP